MNFLMKDGQIWGKSIKKIIIILSKNKQTP
jgi:hypothetical protein